MSTHKALIRWDRAGPEFKKGRYSREHTWMFDGGITVPASPSPSVVPAPYSNAACVDPEEAFVAAAASCHMLTFLHLAHKAGFEVTLYEDEAVGIMTKGDGGVPWISEITLHPHVAYGGERAPTSSEVQALHHAAHEQCYIARSIKTEVRVADDAPP